MSLTIHQRGRATLMARLPHCSIVWSGKPVRATVGPRCVCALFGPPTALRSTATENARIAGELILSEAAEQLAVDPVVLRRLISSGALPARQACKGAPWIIRREALRSPDVLDQVSPGRPLTPNPNQTILDFQ